MNILICNVGSTSLKYQLFDMSHAEQVLASGGAERVGQAKSLFYHKNNRTGDSVRMEAVFPTHREAICQMLEYLLSGCIESLEEIACVLQGRPCQGRHRRTVSDGGCAAGHGGF